MKKIIALLLAAIMVLGLAACASKTETTEASDVKNVVYIVNGNLGDKSFFDSAQAGINKLIDELKALVDSGELSIRAGVELSFLSEDTQAVVAECAEESKIDMKKAKMLRASADDEGNIERYTVESIISGEDGEAKPKPKSVKISNDTYTKYFSDGVKAKEITETIEKALAFYFENMEEN